MVNEKLATFSLTNNINLIRIFAAIQVALAHSASHLEVQLPSCFNVLSLFPGVPIFLVGYPMYFYPCWFYQQLFQTELYQTKFLEEMTSLMGYIYITWWL
ncbi:hypothetical protein [Aquirufa nivalisilvae]